MLDEQPHTFTQVGRQRPGLVVFKSNRCGYKEVLSGWVLCIIHTQMLKSKKPTHQGLFDFRLFKESKGLGQSFCWRRESFQRLFCCWRW